MRQRLLLVAGWVLAAVGTSVVASAAVAATGGQVTDRALRPLTAAEVAAFPGGFLEVLSESLASGDSSNEDLGESGEGTRPGQTTQSPAGGEGDPFTGFDRSRSDDGSYLTPGSDGPTPILSDLPEVTDPDPVAPGSAVAAETHIEHVVAGSVSLAGTDDHIRLLWATPRVGWQIEIQFVSADRLIVSFSDGSEIWTIVGQMVDGAIDVTTSQTSGLS